MRDFKLTTEGELVVTDNGDLAIVEGDEAYAQEIMFRLKTTKGDWMLSPQVGANLEEFIGSPNTTETHFAIEQRILEELTRDNLLFSPEVSCVPLTDNEVFILVTFPSVEEEKRTIQIQANLDLRKGLVFTRSAFLDL